eukprot:SAG25_NODE_2764_length_1396_cov_2.159599_2_plen_96_part_00
MVLAVGGVEAVVEVLRAHAGVAAVLAAGCGVACYLAASDEGQAALRRAKAVELAHAATRNHLSHKGVQEKSAGDSVSVAGYTVRVDSVHVCSTPV